MTHVRGLKARIERKEVITTETLQPAAEFTPTQPTPVESTPTAEAPLVTTEVTITAAAAVACIIGIVAFWALRKRNKTANN